VNCSWKSGSSLTATFLDKKKKNIGSVPWGKTSGDSLMFALALQEKRFKPISRQ